MTPRLINTPPRLSDLRGDDLALALRARHERHREEWLRDRQPSGFFARLMDLVRS
jgi:hypothetical protein